MTVDLQHAEQGKVLRVPFVTLNAGVPFNPAVFSMRVHPGQDVTLGTEIATLFPVSTGQIGRYYADWNIPRATPTGFYTIYVDADAGVFVQSTPFELFAEGTFNVTEQPSAQNVDTVISTLSKARNEDVFAELVRMILRDHPKLNRLTQGRETSPGEIKAAAAMCISKYNVFPPLITPVTFSSFPSMGSLVIGTIGWVLMSSSLLRLRNNLNYSEGGVTVDTENAQAYIQLGQMFMQQFEQWAKEYKIAKNLNDAFGGSPTGVHSEYMLLSSLLGDSSWGGGSGILMQ